MKLQKLTKNDLNQLDDIKPVEWGSIKKSHIYYLENSFCYPCKVELDNELAGLGTLVTHGKSAWLGHVIVKEQHRRKGIGSFIVKQLVRKASEMGIVTVSLIASESGYPVYKRAGFSEDGTYTVFEREITDGPVDREPVTNGRTFVPFGPEYRDRILELDYMASGEYRENTLESQFDNMLLSVRDGKVLGFAIRDFYENPVLAVDREEGIALLEQTTGSREKVVCPTENEAACNFLKSRNFRESKRIPRMRIGNTIDWKAEFIFSRICGFLG